MSDVANNMVVENSTPAYPRDVKYPEFLCGDYSFLVSYSPGVARYSVAIMREGHDLTGFKDFASNDPGIKKHMRWRESVALKELHKLVKDDDFWRALNDHFDPLATSNKSKNRLEFEVAEAVEAIAHSVRRFSTALVAEEERQYAWVGKSEDRAYKLLKAFLDKRGTLGENEKKALTRARVHDFRRVKARIRVARAYPHLTEKAVPRRPAPANAAPVGQTAECV